MRYFLDFDRTIFDTPAFKKKFLFQVFFQKNLGLEEFLYPDVPEFLQQHGENITIVTYGVRAFIMAKVTDALRDFTLADIVYARRSKGHVMSRLIDELEGPYTFVDDMHFQLRSVSKKCPDVEVFEIRRDGKEGNGQWPVIRSLNELPAS